MKYKGQPPKFKSVGFTLVEMLLYIGLLTGFLLVLTELFVSSLEVERESEATAAVSADGQYILSRLRYDVGQANDIVQPAALGEQTNTLEIIVDGSTFTYLVSDGVLRLTNELGSHAVNSYATTISDFSVQKLGNVGGKPTALTSFTVTSKTQRPKGTETATFQTTLGVR